MNSRLELIAQDVLAAVSNVTTGNGYSFTLEVERVKQKSLPKHLLALIHQLPGEPVDDSANQAEDWIGSFAIVVYVIPLETDTTPVDSYSNEAAAAIHRELMRDYTRSGLAIDTKMKAPIFFPPIEGEFAGVTVLFDVKYRHAMDDPFNA